MSRRFYLLRHGETELGQCYLGRTDARLTNTGRLQMYRGLDAYTPDQFQVVISSPLLRCAEFAAQWAGEERVRIEPRLAEYDFGDWDGLTGAEIYARDPRALERFWKDPWCYPAPNGERLDHFFHRLSSLLDELEAAYDGSILLICHGGVIRAVNCIVNRHPIDRMSDIEVSHGSLHLFRR